MQVTQHKPSNAKKQKENKYSSQAEPVRAKKGKNTSDIKFRYVKENTSAYSNVFTKDPNLRQESSKRCRLSATGKICSLYKGFVLTKTAI